MEKYGPFSPQELDLPLKWLENHKLYFEMTKDDSVEGRFKKNDPSNMLSLTELRTNVYLAQIFYLEIQFDSIELKKEFETQFVTKSEVIPIWINKINMIESFDHSIVGRRQQKQKRVKQLFSVGLLTVWMMYIIFTYLRN